MGRKCPVSLVLAVILLVFLEVFLIWSLAQFLCPGGGMPAPQPGWDVNFGVSRPVHGIHGVLSRMGWFQVYLMAWALAVLQALVLYVKDLVFWLLPGGGR